MKGRTKPSQKAKEIKSHRKETDSTGFPSTPIVAATGLETFLAHTVGR